MPKILSVFGTRPEAIKFATVIRFLEANPDFESRVCLTGQHKDLVSEVLDTFSIRPDYDLDVMQPNQELTILTAKVLAGVKEVIDQERPDGLLVQGDTTSAFAAALSGSYMGIKIGHIEAGLRSNNKQQPFPEETNRRLISTLADWHFAPTLQAQSNLLKEGVDPESVFLTGNTIVDSLHWIISANENSHEPRFEELEFLNHDSKRVIVATIHRRESFGRPLERLCETFKVIADKFSNIQLVFLVHPNPKISEPVKRILGETRNICLLPPLRYRSFIKLLHSAYLIITDSGGIQEEAPVLGKPVLVVRESNDRPEAVAAGNAMLVGFKQEVIINTLETLLTNRDVYAAASASSSPFGDGHAAEKIVQTLQRLLL